MPLAMGMRMRASALRSTSSGRPAPSLPTRRATGSHQSTSQGESSGVIVLEGDALKCVPTTEEDADGEASCADEARVRTLAIFSCVRRIGSDIPERIGRWSAAPAEARKAFGENGLAVPDWPEAA